MGKWFSNPTKRSLFYITLLWVIGVAMLFIATDFFRRQSISVSIMIFLSAISITGIYKRYYENKKSGLIENKDRKVR